MVSGFWLLSTTGWVAEAPKFLRPDLKKKGPWVTTRAGCSVHEQNTWCHTGGSPVWSPLTCSTMTSHCRRIQFTDQSVKNKEQHVEFHLQPKIKPWMFCYENERDLHLFLTALPRSCHSFGTIYVVGRASRLVMEEPYQCLADQTVLKENQTSTGNHHQYLPALWRFLLFSLNK